MPLAAGNVRYGVERTSRGLENAQGGEVDEVAESKGLKKGNRVYWRGDATDGGIITEMSWDAVTITWDNGQVATVHHGDMREIQRAPAKPIIV